MAPAERTVGAVVEGDGMVDWVWGVGEWYGIVVQGKAWMEAGLGGKMEV